MARYGANLHAAPPEWRRVPVATVDEAMTLIEAAFWRHYEKNERMRAALAGKDRRILLDLEGDARSVVVRDGKIVEVRRGPVEAPDVVLRAKPVDFLDIVNKRLHPLKAYMEGRVKVKAPMRDLLLVKAFL